MSWSCRCFGRIAISCYWLSVPSVSARNSFMKLDCLLFRCDTGFVGKQLARAIILAKGIRPLAESSKRPHYAAVRVLAQGVKSQRPSRRGESGGMHAGGGIQVGKPEKSL